jgi:hypothetical protein
MTDASGMLFSEPDGKLQPEKHKENIKTGMKKAEKNLAIANRALEVIDDLIAKGL